MATKSLEKYPGQRKKEKQSFFRRFMFRVIEDLYRRKFFSLFNNQCFRCGLPEKPAPEIGRPPLLCIDHHLPLARGGHFEAGNLVALCRPCNQQKLDRPPEIFYTPAELARLQPLLNAQQELFMFAFDWNRWNSDREGYLLAIGLTHEIVQSALHDENFVGYVGPGGDTAYGVTITIDLSDLRISLDHPDH